MVILKGIIFISKLLQKESFWSGNNSFWSYHNYLILNQVCTWFLEITFVHDVDMHVWMCVCTPENINNQWHDMVWYRRIIISQDGHGLSNTVCCEHLTKKTSWCRTYHWRWFNCLAVAIRRITSVIKVSGQTCSGQTWVGKYTHKMCV